MEYNYSEIAKEYQFLNDIINKVINGWTGIIEIDMSGSRWSAKTKSIEKMLVKLLAQEKLKTRVVCGKYTVDGAKELWGEFEEEFQQFPEKFFTTNKTERIAKRGLNEMKVLGFKSNRSEKVGKLGIKRGTDVDLLVTFVDEVLQWQKSEELSALYQAAGGGKTIINICATNPFTPYHWYIGKLHTDFKQSEHIMRTKGQQFFKEESKVEIENEDGTISIVDKIRVVHFSNHRINEFLSPAQHQMLIDTWKTNPHQARVIDWGMMGVEEGAIYEYVIDNMTSQMHTFDKYDSIYYKGGGDWGIVNDATTAHFHRYSVDGDVIDKWNIEEEFHFSNKDKKFYDSTQPNKKFIQPLDSHGMAAQMVDFYINCYKRYCEEGEVVYIFIDNSAISFIEILNNTSYRLDYGSFIKFERGTKKPIKERVRLTLLAAGAGIIKVGDRCLNLKGELHMATYKDNPNSNTYREGLDHHQDAMEYALSSEWVKLTASVSSWK